MAADGHLGYTKMATTSQPVCRSTCYLVLGLFGSRVGFSGTAELMVQLWNFKNPRWQYTRTAVARNPCVSWAFLSLLFMSTSVQEVYGQGFCTILAVFMWRSIGTFARALDCTSTVRQPSLHMSAAAASRDITLVWPSNISIFQLCK